jgi:pimeloyl-ACP methyl ester carboxylesterase
MRTVLELASMAVVLTSIALAASPARAQTSLDVTQCAEPCEEYLLPSGANTLICVPASGWNGDLFMWAHGYVAPQAPLAFENLVLPDGGCFPALVNSLGYAFATTTYRRTGLAILEGVDDMRDLLARFQDTRGNPAHAYVVGASEGGIVTTLSLERHPDLYTGGLSMCGPIGNFRKQIDYWGDFRVLFDYFFPGLLPGSPINIPQGLIDNWFTVYVPLVVAALAAHPEAAVQLIKTSRAAIDPADPTTVVETTLGLLWYSVFATNDGVARLGGNPYGNVGRWYFGSSNDLALNLGVERFAASPVAVATMDSYQTSGDLHVPMVTLHTIGDQIIPYWHELLYIAKAHPTGGGSLTPIPILRYGHCNFTSDEVLSAFGLLVVQSL